MSFDGCDWWSYLEWDAIVWSPPTPHILCEIEVEQAHLPFRNICKIPYSPQVQRFMTGKQSMYVQCLAGCILYMEHLSLNVWHHAYKVLRRLKLVVSFLPLLLIWALTRRYSRKRVKISSELWHLHLLSTLAEEIIHPSFKQVWTPYVGGGFNTWPGYSRTIWLPQLAQSCFIHLPLLAFGWPFPSTHSTPSVPFFFFSPLILWEFILKLGTNQPVTVHCFATPP